MITVGVAAAVVLDCDGERPPEDPIFREVVEPAIIIQEYDPTWPETFQQISTKLRFYLDQCQVKYLSIDHVGSTSVPGLAAKCNIDIIIEVPDQHNAELAKEALTHEPPPEEHYKCIGDGGIRGRISMKLHDRTELPAQSVYIVNKKDPNGRLIMRCHRALRDTLRRAEHESLMKEYGQTKMDIAAHVRDGVEYGQKKNAVIRRILQAAGWTDEEIDEKEALDYRVPGLGDEYEL